MTLEYSLNDPRTFVTLRDNVLHESTPVDGHVLYPVEHCIPGGTSVGDMSLWLSNHRSSLQLYFTFHYFILSILASILASVLRSLADLRWYSPLVVRLSLSYQAVSLNRILKSISTANFFEADRMT
jgi:hypothetical protein